MYTKKDLLEKLNISQATLIRWEKIGFIPEPRRLGRVRFYTEKEMQSILDKVKQVEMSPQEYNYINVRLKRTRFNQSVKNTT